MKNLNRLFWTCIIVGIIIDLIVGWYNLPSTGGTRFLYILAMCCLILEAGLEDLQSILKNLKGDKNE
jgi:hypothetical protein